MVSSHAGPASRPLDETWPVLFRNSAKTKLMNSIWPAIATTDGQGARNVAGWRRASAQKGELGKGRDRPPAPRDLEVSREGYREWAPLRPWWSRLEKKQWT